MYFKVLSTIVGNIIIIIIAYIYYVPEPLLRHLNYLIFIKPYEGGVVVISILQIRNLRFKEIY